MKMHANARLSLKGRELLIDHVEHAGWSLVAAAEAAGSSDRTRASGSPVTAVRGGTVCLIVPRRLRSSRTAPRSSGSR